MKSIEYYYRENNHNFLTSVTNKDGLEYIYGDNGYTRLLFNSRPYVLRTTIETEQKSPLTYAQSRKINFLVPVVLASCENYIQIPFEQYKQIRNNRERVEYVMISEYDRLKLNAWIKNERNHKYDIVSYDDLSEVIHKQSFPVKRRSAKRICALNESKS